MRRRVSSPEEKQILVQNRFHVSRRMAEDAAKAKRVRGAKLGVFNRKYSHLEQLIENDALAQAKESFSELKK